MYWNCRKNTVLSKLDPKRIKTCPLCVVPRTKPSTFQIFNFQITKDKSEMSKRLRDDSLEGYLLSKRSKALEQSAREVDFTLGRATNNIFVQAINREGENYGGYWTKLERIVLVGNIYDQLFQNPVLCQSSWDVIVPNFQRHCNQLGMNLNRKRSKTAIQRYFKELKRENMGNGMKLFKSLYMQWKMLKSMN
eukprot:maker-scaffold_11-snap-gene-12.9-mRNA-1 protein AED:0.08 eAED:0.19 QI:0/0/0/0.66/0/0/3/0/191